MNKNFVPTFEQYIFEGKYDKLTGILTKKIFNFLKVGYSLYSLGLLDQLGKIDDEGFFGAFVSDDKTILDVDTFLRFKFSKDVSSTGFAIEAFAYNKKGEDAAIEVVITLDPNRIPRIYSYLNGFIQDAVRHEIEHLTQGGENKKPFRPMPTRSKIRNRISVEKGNAYKYYILRDEIPAMCHGMYRKAKVEKITLDAAFDIYLNYIVEEDIISNQEKELVLKKWFEYSLKHLPAAQYSKKYDFILDKLRKNS